MNPNIIAPTKHQLKQLVEIIMKQYEKLEEKNRYNQQARSVKQMLMKLIIMNQKQNKTQKQLERSIYAQNNVAYINSQQFICHLSQQEIQRLLHRRNDKILRRIVDLKNTTQQKLDHISQKYDQLLQMFKKSNKKQKELNERIKQLEDQNRKQRQQIINLQAKLKKAKEHFPKLVQLLKSLKKKLQDYKDMFIYQRTLLYDCFNWNRSGMIQSLVYMHTRYNNFINNLRDELKKREEQIIRMRHQSAKKQTNLSNIMRQLICDLSEAINFKKTQGQDDFKWFSKYREYKKSLQDMDVELNKKSVFQPYKQSDNKKFILNQRQKLDQYKNLTNVK